MFVNTFFEKIFNFFYIFSAVVYYLLIDVIKAKACLAAQIVIDVIPDTRKRHNAYVRVHADYVEAIIRPRSLHSLSVTPAVPACSAFNRAVEHPALGKS